eukprot:CAMPEP_0116984696 /NCGR_PEP_ID=MMETSP0467-20121206/61773_1 /TAXON_ID=283647 /ORGANISM="Mesodinium pulex, Strain SPMC105" /LENGTH=76 /DNA_ID=CAMNT_0004679791 /DNA_START=659 /DNA_END=886 /DNA_ORIENTATION=-
MKTRIKNYLENDSACREVIKEQKSMLMRLSNEVQSGGGQNLDNEETIRMERNIISKMELDLEALQQEILDQKRKGM